MIAVIGSFRLPLEQVEAAREAMRRVVAASRAEPGCLAYAYGEDVSEPGLFRVSELWSSREALAAHFASPHMARWMEERQALGMTGREVVVYAVDNGEAL